MKNPTLAVSKGGRRRHTLAAERERWIRAWEASDQTQREFAEANGLCVGTLRNWLRGTRRPRVDEITFQQINVADALAPEINALRSEWEFELRLPGGLRIGVARGTPPRRVRELVEGLRC